MASMPGDAPILVNSAGCGAALKDYGHLLGTDEARRRSRPACSTSTSGSPPARPRCPTLRPLGKPVIVQDPCHLRHVQKAHLPVRAVVGRVADVVELDDDGLCCGAGGAYSALQPELAGEIRDRKVAADRAGPPARSGATVARQRQPGLQHAPAAGARRGGTRVRHPIDLLAEALP